MGDRMINKKRKGKLVTGIVYIGIILALLWLFTPIGFLTVRPQGEYQIKVMVNGKEMTATMENKKSSWAFHRMLSFGPKTVHMRDYGGMEKVGMLWKGLPSDNEQITTDPGDIVLFMGSSIVVYYDHNAWNFTRMGHIDNVSQEELRSILGVSNVTIRYELMEPAKENNEMTGALADTASTIPSKTADVKKDLETITENKDTMEASDMITLSVNGHALSAKLADNASAQALKELLKDGPLTISMRDYAGMEKVGDIGQELPSHDEQISTEAGDLILYQNRALVIYYDTNSWNFTRLGKIQDVTQKELRDILGTGDVTVTIESK